MDGAGFPLLLGESRSTHESDNTRSSPEPNYVSADTQPVRGNEAIPRLSEDWGLKIRSDQATESGEAPALR